MNLEMKYKTTFDAEYDKKDNIFLTWQKQKIIHAKTKRVRESTRYCVLVIFFYDDK